MMQVAGVTFLCLTIALTSCASTREELERAAELAVERAAERVAEKAVEKALEAGNSSTETETIRASHSSIRKYDFTQQLPSYTILTPEEREDMLRIEKEQDAAELAVKQIKHSLFRRQVDDFGPNYEAEGADDFDDVGPSFGGGGESVDDDVNTGFGDGSKTDEDDVSPGFGRLGRLPFGGFGSGFESESSGLGLSSGDFTSSRFIRQYPYGNPYQNTHYRFVPIHQETSVGKIEAKPAEPKKQEQLQVAPTIKHLIPPLSIYQVETKPLFYYAPPINHYAAPFVYQQPHVKIFQQSGDAQSETPVKEKRERRGPF